LIPTRYTLYPTAALRRSDVPIHLRWTYLVLYALAWTHQYEWLGENYEQLSQTFSDLEGQVISPRGIRQRLSDLVEYGLVERRRVEGRYRTYLLVRHDTSDAPSVTSPPSGDALQRHPIKNKYVVADEETVSDQQQQYSNQGDVDRILRNEELLRGMGLIGDVVRRLAAEEQVTPEYLEAVMGFRAREAAQGRILGTGWVVTCVGEGWEVPQPQTESRYRYIQGKYKEFVRH
jgi:hypothetical protein